MEGIVKFYNATKGYGFITGSDDTDYFVHVVDIAGTDFDTLLKGQHVIFDVRPDPRGRNPQAKNLRAPDTKPAPRASAPRKAASATAS